MAQNNVIHIVEIVIGLLFIASLVAIAVRRLRMPYTVGLVLVGLGMALVVGELPGEVFDLKTVRGLLLPELILAILVPPLIFEAAFHLHFEDLRRNLKTILAFAIPGVVLTMVMVGGIAAWGTNLSFEMALVFGALIAATDPVAVVALFRSMGVPKRLQVLLEGESLLNDGTAIVIYNIMLVIALGISEFEPAAILVDFLRIAGGGLIVGAVLAALFSYVIGLVNDYLIEITLTAICAYGSYLVAENMHVSGVLAVVAAGMVVGNIGPSRMGPTTRISLATFWELAAFLANSFAFLLIGIVIELPTILHNALPILLAIGAVLLARAVVIYLF
ncbi:MAG: cation:proton antiporter, partial [Anaerolineae bacterium]|nr:cation:proton antiporter [Anaerolineae bacterium]